MKKLIFLTIIAIAQSALATETATAAKPNVDQAAVAASEATYIMCKNKEIVRTVRVEKAETGGGCVTKYTKQGIDSIVASSWTEKRCKAVLGNIQTNLESANWKCKDISTSRVSSSVAE